MNYSLLEDAWGNQSNLSSQYNKYMSENIYIQNKQNCSTMPQGNSIVEQPPTQHQKVELEMKQVPLPSVPMDNYKKPVSVDNSNNNYKIEPSDNFPVYRNIEHFSDIDNNIECEKFMNHIKRCGKCFNKFKGLFRPRYMNSFHNFIDNNLDTVILILIFIFVLLCHNLLTNLIKSKS